MSLCVCVDVNAHDAALLHVCVWVSWFILLSVFPIAAHTNQPEESSPDETPTLMPAGEKEKALPLGYLRMPPRPGSHTHKHTLHESQLIFNHAPICHGERTRK